MGPRASVTLRLCLVCLVAASIAVGPAIAADPAVTASGTATGTDREAVGPGPGLESAIEAVTAETSTATSVPTAGSSGVAGVGTRPAQTAAPESTPEVSLSVSRVSGTDLELTATFDVPAAIEDFRVIAGTVDVREAEGFSECGSNRLCWDGSADEPTLTVRHDLTAYAETDTGIVNDSAVFVPAPRIYTVWRTDDGRRTAPLFAKAEYAAYDVVSERTVIGNATLFHGPHAEYERTVAGGTGEMGTTVRLIVPEGVRLGPSRERLFDAFDGAAETLDVGGVIREVIAVALGNTPQATEYGLAGATVGNTFWARAGGSLSSTHNVWLHEYVHTRQRFADRDREMEWFVEASAEYYAARLAYELGLVGDLEYEWEMKSRRASASDSTLADPATWSRPAVPYRKGALTLAALDAEIRNRTDGERTLEDVFGQLNRADRTLTYELFANTVVSVSGDPAMREWLDRYVRGGATPRYEPRDPRSRLPNPPRLDDVAALVPTSPLGFGVAAVGLMAASMVALSALSLLGRSLGRLVAAIVGVTGRLADLLSGREP